MYTSVKAKGVPVGQKPKQIPGKVNIPDRMLNRLVFIFVVNKDPEEFCFYRYGFGCLLRYVCVSTGIHNKREPKYHREPDKHRQTDRRIIVGCPRGWGRNVDSAPSLCVSVPVLQPVYLVHVL